MKHTTAETIRSTVDFPYCGFVIRPGETHNSLFEKNMDKRVDEYIELFTRLYDGLESIRPGDMGFAPSNYN